MISVVIPSLVKDEETFSHLFNCLDYLERSTDRANYQLIIVDNGSVLGQDLMKSKADIYIRKEYAMGYTRATNLGMALADHDYIAVLNNDDYVPSGWIEGFTEALQEFPGAVCAMDHETEPRVFQDAAFGSFWMITRRVLSEVGYMNEDMNWRYSDQDYWCRIKSAGLNVCRTGKVVVKHFDGTTYRKLGKGVEEEAERQKMLSRWGYPTFHEWVRSKL